MEDDIKILEIQILKAKQSRNLKTRLSAELSQKPREPGGPARPTNKERAARDGAADFRAANGRGERDGQPPRS